MLQWFESIDSTISQSARNGGTGILKLIWHSLTSSSSLLPRASEGDKCSQMSCPEATVEDFALARVRSVGLILVRGVLTKD